MLSENRAAAALSRDYSGAKMAFVSRMNGQVASLGMYDSHFSDSSALSPDNASSVCDSEKLLHAAYYVPRIRRHTVARQLKILNGTFGYRNSKLLVRARSLNVHLQKTGFTNEAENCLVMAIVIQEHVVNIVILRESDSQGHIEDSRKIRSWLKHRGNRPGVMSGGCVTKQEPY